MKNTSWTLTNGVYNKRRTPAKVLVIKGTSALSSQIVDALNGASFNIACIPSLPETVTAMCVFKPEVIVADETVVDSGEICNQISNTMGAPVLLVRKDTGTYTSVEVYTGFFSKRTYEQKLILAKLKHILTFRC